MGIDRDLVIIGAGAAGLAAAQYGARANLSVLVIEELAAGGQGLEIDQLENYPAFPDALSGMEFSERMEKQAKKFGAEFMITTATALTKESDAFRISTTDGDLRSHTIVLATGAKHRRLGVPGEAEFAGRGVSYCATCDGPFFKNKRILVVGGGDMACDESTYLANLSDKIGIVHRRGSFRAQASLAARVLANPHIDVRFHTIVREIRGAQKLESVLLSRTDRDEAWEESASAVFVFVGTEPQTSLVPFVPKDEAGYVVTDQNMETNVRGLFAAGDVRATPFRQLVVAAGEGAVAAHKAAQYVDELKGRSYR